MLDHSASNRASTRRVACWKCIGELVCLPADDRIRGPLTLGAHTRRGHREQLRSYVDNAPEESLPLLQFGLPTRHPVERVARQLAGGAFDEPQVRCQLTELVVRRGPLPFTESQLRQPLCIEPARAHRGGSLLPQPGVGLGEIAGRGQVGIDRLPGDEQPHDLARPFEDPVDPQIAQLLLDRYRALPARGQGLGGLIPPPTADLQ